MSVTGFIIWLAPSIVLAISANYGWKHWSGKVCAVLSCLWFLFFIPAIMGWDGKTFQDDIDESASIETIHISLIRRYQNGDESARSAENSLLEKVEQHPGYEPNSGIRRWKKAA